MQRWDGRSFMARDSRKPTLEKEARTVPANFDRRKWGRRAVPP